MTKSVEHNLAASDGTTSLKESSHFIVVESITKVLDVDVGELLRSITHHVNTFTSRHEPVSYTHLTLPTNREV